jgi:SAM-dependent methyltransferase
VEISEPAVVEAEKALDQVVQDLGDIPDESVDVVISYHALEHVDAPAAIMRECHRVLKTSGIIRVVVPAETAFLKVRDRHWRENKEMHLQTWTPLLIGNSLSAAGFIVDDARMLPGSHGSRIMNLCGSALSRLGRWLKALHAGRIHAVATAHKSCTREIDPPSRRSGALAHRHLKRAEKSLDRRKIGVRHVLVTVLAGQVYIEARGRYTFRLGQTLLTT